MALTRVGAVTLNAGENFADCAVIDVPNGFAYFGVSLSIVRIKLSNFTRDTKLATADDNASAVADLGNGFAYFGDNVIGTSHSQKIRLSDFTNQGNTVLDTSDRPRSACIDTVNGFAYFGMASGAFENIVKVRLSDNAKVGTLTFAGYAGTDVCASLIDTKNGFAYFGMNTFPGQVKKMRLSDFSDRGTLSLTGSVVATGSAVIDTINGFAYFTDDAFPTASLHKVRLSDFTEVAVASFNANENFALFGQPGFIAPKQGAGFAYFPTYTTPIQVTKWDLSTFTEVASLSLNAGENSADSAVIDTTNGLAYIGSDTMPAIIIKVSDPDMVVPVTAAVTNKTGRSLFRGRGASEQTGTVCGIGRRRK